MVSFLILQMTSFCYKRDYGMRPKIQTKSVNDRFCGFLQSSMRVVELLEIILRSKDFVEKNFDITIELLSRCCNKLYDDPWNSTYPFQIFQAWKNKLSN